jgi:hypothetical protein
MALPLETVAFSFIESNLIPGQHGSSSPFQFLGLRPYCTIEEVDKRSKELRSKFHPDRLDEKLSKHLSLTFKVAFTQQDCTTDQHVSCSYTCMQFMIVHMYMCYINAIPQDQDAIRDIIIRFHNDRLTEALQEAVNQSTGVWKQDPNS